MERVTLYHRTRLAVLPLVETDGLRTRVDLSEREGPLDAFDLAATGRFARGRRVSGWVSRAHAESRITQLGAGLVSYTVDPRKAVANREEAREADPVAVWSDVRSLADRLAEVGGDVAALPDDLEVHIDLPVRAKLLRLHAPDVTDEDLGVYAGVVAAIADSDRVAARTIMHLALAAADGDADTPAFRAACALAWRDEPDDRELILRWRRADPVAVLEVVIAELEESAPESSAVIAGMLDESSRQADDAGIGLAEMLLESSERSLETLTRP
jgi:hypothetical protein